MCACADDSGHQVRASFRGRAHAGRQQPERAFVDSPRAPRARWRQLHAERAHAQRALRGQGDPAHCAAAHRGARAPLRRATPQPSGMLVSEGAELAWTGNCPETCMAPQVAVHRAASAYWQTYLRGSRCGSFLQHCNVFFASQADASSCCCTGLQVVLSSLLVICSSILGTTLACN